MMLSANILVVLIYIFYSGDHKSIFKVGLFHNERLTLIPSCSELWCDLDEVKHIFESQMSECHLRNICHTNLTLDDANATADDRF